MVAALAARSGGTSGTRRLADPVRWCCILWALAATWGSVVGLLSGVSLRGVIAQTLALAFLPLAALAFGAWRGVGEDQLERGARLGLVLALVVTLVVFRGDLEAALVDRLRIDAGRSFAPPALLVLFLSLGRLVVGRGGAAPALGLGTALFFVLGSQSRGQWIAALVGLLVFSIWSLPRRGRRLLAGTTVVAALLIGGCWALVHRLPPPELLERRGPVHLVDGRFLELPVPEGTEALLLDVRARSPREGTLLLWASVRDGRGDEIAARWRSVRGPGGPVHFGSVLWLPPGAVDVAIGAKARRGSWDLSGAEVHGLSSRTEALLRHLGLPPLGPTRRDIPSLLGARSLEILAGLADPRRDETLRYRLDETDAVLASWRRGNVLRRWLGFGLGAAYEFENPSWEGDERLRVSEASYIHNVYVYLPYKLGIVGVLPLACALVLLLDLVRRARRTNRPPWPEASAAAIWVALLVWGVTSPELVDFRITPLLGALTALSVRPPRRTEMT